MTLNGPDATRRPPAPPAADAPEGPGAHRGDGHPGAPQLHAGRGRRGPAAPRRALGGHPAGRRPHRDHRGGCYREPAGHRLRVQEQEAQESRYT